MHVAQTGIFSPCPIALRQPVHTREMAAMISEWVVAPEGGVSLDSTVGIPPRLLRLRK